VTSSEKSQHQNRAIAMQVLRARLYDMERQRPTPNARPRRKSQVGSGDRSERIRTYNFPQGRLTDHRIGLTLYRLTEILAGDLDEVIDALWPRTRRRSSPRRGCDGSEALARPRAPLRRRASRARRATRGGFWPMRWGWRRTCWRGGFGPAARGAAARLRHRSSPARGARAGQPHHRPARLLGPRLPRDARRARPPARDRDAGGAGAGRAVRAGARPRHRVGLHPRDASGRAPGGAGVGTDISPEALLVAGGNAAAHGVADRLVLPPSDWFADIGGRFDLIVSNPPYIAADEMAGWPPRCATTSRTGADRRGRRAVGLPRHRGGGAGPPDARRAASGRDRADAGRGGFPAFSRRRGLNGSPCIPISMGGTGSCPPAGG
jgi:hypothetical protein